MFRLALDPYLENQLPYTTFFIAVAVATYYTGLGPSLTTALLGGLAANWFFMPPRDSFGPLDFTHLIGYAMYFMVSLTCVGFGQALRRAQRRAEIVADGLQREVTALKQGEDALREAEERARLATEATAVGIWEWNVMTNEIRWDSQMFRIYGRPKTPDGVVTYGTWSESVLPEDLPHQERILMNTVRQLGHSARNFPHSKSG